MALPLNCAAIQSVQTNSPSKNEMGLDAPHHIHLSLEGTEEYLFLTSSFIGLVLGRYLTIWHIDLSSLDDPEVYSCVFRASLFHAELSVMRAADGTGHFGVIE